MKEASRIAAVIEVLDAVDGTDRPADRVLERYLRDRRYIGSSDRAAITDRVWGVLRRRARLDWWIKRAGAGLHRDARGRVLADLALTDRLTVAAVAELADGARHAPDPLSKDESGALRHLVGQPLDHADMPPPVRAECPTWLWPHMQAMFGDEAEEAVRALGQEATFDLRLNILSQLSRNDAISSLEKEDIPAQSTALSPLGIRFDRRRPIDRLELFKSGAIEVQDEGSQLAALLVGAAPGMTVVDYCAGAGGKALALAACMANKGRLLLMDTSQGRLDRAATRLRRAGVHNAERRVLTEGGKMLKRLAGKADRVLVDAPCTGTGTWRRNPDAKWRYDATALTEITARQRTILERAAALVKPGGRLIYVTCSVLAEENEAVVDGFLAESTAFTARPIGEVWAETVPAQGGAACPAAPDEMYLRLAPHRDGTDGFFVAVLERAHAPG